MDGFIPDETYMCALWASNSAGRGPEAVMTMTFMDDGKIIFREGESRWAKKATSISMKVKLHDKFQYSKSSQALNRSQNIPHIYQSQ